MFQNLEMHYRQTFDTKLHKSLSKFKVHAYKENITMNETFSNEFSEEVNYILFWLTLKYCLGLKKNIY